MNQIKKGSFKDKLPFFSIIFIFIIFTGLLVVAQFYPNLSNNSHNNDDNSQHYSAKGVIYDFNLKENKILINHDKIEGYMENYDNKSTYFNIINKNSLQDLNIGDSISFDIHKTSLDNYHIENIKWINSSPLKIYDAIGVIHDIIKDKHKLLINHEEIPGWMSKMTMMLDVHNEISIKHLNIGDSISFNFVLNEIQDSYFISNFKKLGISKVIEAQIENEFWEDEYDLKNVGQTLDDATFVDLNSNKVKLTDINSDYKLISFIFSRCPIPTLCPAIISNNQYLANHFKNENIKFLIISFDYMYDTPKILNDRYGLLQKKNKNLLFLSSYEHLTDLYRLTEQMGYYYAGVEEDDISHLNKIAIVDKNNKILKYYDSFDVTAKEIKEDLEQLLAY